jgi:hypothetical protein
MLFTRTEITGVDSPIDGFQRMLYPKIVAVWGMETGSVKDYNSYARAYKNQTEDGYIPEVFVGGKEYKEVLVDDRIKALSFFTVNDNISFSGNQLKGQVSLLFFINLEKIAPGINRNDEKVRQQIIQMVQGTKSYGFDFQGVETGIDNVLRDFSGLRKTIGMKYRDMHPFHCFKLNFTVNYKSNC